MVSFNRTTVGGIPYQPPGQFSFFESWNSLGVRADNYNIGNIRIFSEKIFFQTELVER